jgi:di/tripeptidase
MAFNNRKYVIIPADSDTMNSINFSEVMETSKDTCRYSVDGTKTFVKYAGEMPASVAAVTGKSQEYTHDEILTILQTEEWTSSEEM